MRRRRMFLPIDGRRGEGQVATVPEGKQSMLIRLTEAERSRLRGVVRRPRSRKQLYRAEALLELDDGRPIEEVARRHRVGIERVEQWIDGFTERRLAYLAEPEGPRPKGPGGEQDPADEEEEENS